MSVAPIETRDVVALPAAVTGSSIPAACWVDDQPWSTHDGWARLLVLDASSTRVYSGIYASPSDVEIPGLTVWPSTSHAVFRWSHGVAQRAGARIFPSGVVPLPDEAGARADMLSFLFSNARPRSAKLEALIARIKGFGELAADWDGDETIAISKVTIAAAMRTADAAARADFPLPQASPSSEGEISLSWYRKRDRLALIIAPDNYVTWTTSDDRSVEPGGVLRVDSPLFPGSIVEALRGFYGRAAGAVSLRG